jgi:raffinose/stachyose/melibiose transport system substrate-binding protein
MKKAMKKLAAATLAGCMALSLAACGNGADSNSNSDSNASANANEGGDGTSGALTVWYHDYSFEDSVVGVIEAFNEKYPEIEVDYEIKADGDYDNLLKTAIQSGEGPDLFWTNGTATSTLPDLVENQALADLKDDVDFSFIPDSAMELVEVDGDAYAVPWMTMDTRTCYYNKAMFEENGWKIPGTFSEFEALLAEIKGKGITPLSQAYDSWCMLFAYEPILAAYDPEYSAGLQDYSVKAKEYGAFKPSGRPDSGIYFRHIHVMPDFPEILPHNTCGLGGIGQAGRLQ